MVTLLILFTGSGLLLAALSVPLILRRIGPNPLYGFRVKQTLEDPAVWYPVNAYAARRLLAVGLAISAGAGVLFLVPGIDLLAYALACGAIGLGGLLVAVVQSFLYLRSFAANGRT
jgi:hypothetical protein